uniref:Galactosyltransferase C-terminal domain-containing protein n=1 Tax=viral metagenome TaxID=1070528 RepID=A0A6C0D923_9ZZZZ
MDFILECCDDYEILFVHQCDNRNFNRGAMKNIGFLAIKEKYPEHYKDISFVFNDVDTLPFHKLFDYETKKGVVKHYYGFATALGGIVVMKGSDFEMVNGYPNYWGWGMEDASLQKRCIAHNLRIDRSTFYPIGSPEILQLFDGVSRLVSQKDPQRMKMDNGQDGLTTIHKLLFSVDKESLNPNDNKYVVKSEKIFVVNVSSFMTLVRFESDSYHEYDLRDPINTILNQNNQHKLTNKTHISPSEWRNIPHNQQANERVLAIQQQRELHMKQHPQQQHLQQQHPQQQHLQQQYPQQQHLQQQYPQQKQNINIFSPNYARLIGQQPRATTSAFIGLGGVR